MNDFDFDKSFSEDFRKNRMEAPSPEKWERMEASLRQMKEQKRRKRGIFFLLLPYLLLAGTAGAFVWQWQGTQQAMAGLQGRVKQLERELETCGKQSAATLGDLSHQEGGRAKTASPAMIDEPRIERAIFTPKAEKAVFGNTEMRQLPVFYKAEKEEVEPVKATGDIGQEAPSTTEMPLAGTTPTDSLEQTIKGQAGKPKQRTNRSPLPAQDYVALASTENNSVEIDAAMKPILVKKPKEPKGFVIGPVGSLNFAYYGGDGKNIGIITQYRIKKGWCIQAGYDYGRNRLRGKIEYDSTAIIFPTPPAQGYSSINITSKQFKSTFHLGVRRYFSLKKRLQPSLSLDWVSIYSHKNTLNRRWLSKDAAKQAINTSETSKIGLWSLSNYQVSGALSYRLHSRIELMAQAGLRVFSKHHSHRHKELSFQLGLLGYF